MVSCYLAMESDSYGYGSIRTDASIDDYRSGIGLRKSNTSDFENLEIIRQMYTSEANWDIFELEFKFQLGAAPTLAQCSQSWWLAPERLTELEVSDIRIAAHISLDPANVAIPFHDNGYGRIEYGNENYFVYSFRIDHKTYLTVYDRATCVVHVISMKERESDEDGSTYFEYPKVYDRRIYYSEDIDILVPVLRNEVRSESYETMYTQIVSVNLDGSDEQILFRYDNEYVEGTVVGGYLPYHSASITHLGEEIIVNVYSGTERYYRMNPDGTNLQLIGELNGFYDKDAIDE